MTAVRPAGRLPRLRRMFPAARPGRVRALTHTAGRRSQRAAHLQPGIAYRPPPPAARHRRRAAHRVRAPRRGQDRPGQLTFGASGTSQSTASGGRVSRAEAGWPCQGWATALHHPEVAHAAAAVRGRVGVDQLAPPARGRQPDPVVEVRGAGEVGQAGDGPRSVLGAARAGEAQEGQDVAVRVVRVDPAEPVGAEVPPPQRGVAAVRLVQVGDQVARRRGARVSPSGGQARPACSDHSASWPNSDPMNSSCLPGCAHW